MRGWLSSSIFPKSLYLLFLWVCCFSFLRRCYYYLHVWVLWNMINWARELKSGLRMVDYQFWCLVTQSRQDQDKKKLKGRISLFVYSCKFECTENQKEIGFSPSTFNKRKQFPPSPSSPHTSYKRESTNKRYKPYFHLLRYNIWERAKAQQALTKTIRFQ